MSATSGTTGSTAWRDVAHELNRRARHILIILNELIEAIASDTMSKPQIITRFLGIFNQLKALKAYMATFTSDGYLRTLHPAPFNLTTDLSPAQLAQLTNDRVSEPSNLSLTLYLRSRDTIEFAKVLDDLKLATIKAYTKSLREAQLPASGDASAFETELASTLNSYEAVRSLAKKLISDLESHNSQCRLLLNTFRDRSIEMEQTSVKTRLASAKEAMPAMDRRALMASNAYVFFENRLLSTHLRRQAPAAPASAPFDPSKDLVNLLHGSAAATSVSKQHPSGSLELGAAHPRTSLQPNLLHIDPSILNPDQLTLQLNQMVQQIMASHKISPATLTDELRVKLLRSAASAQQALKDSFAQSRARSAAAQPPAPPPQS